MAHGFALFFVLLIAQIPYFAINIIAPNIIAAIALFFAYCFVDGFIAKYVGEQFEFEEEYV